MKKTASTERRARVSEKSPTSARRHGAHGQQHGIGRGHVIVAPLAEEEERKRDEVHPGEHAIAAVAQKCRQAGEPDSGAAKRLAQMRNWPEQESFGAALPTSRA